MSDFITVVLISSFLSLRKELITFKELPVRPHFLSCAVIASGQHLSKAFERSSAMQSVCDLLFIPSTA